MARAKSLAKFFADTYRKWSDDRAMRMAAALSYYLVFSLAPLLFILTGILGTLAQGLLLRVGVDHELRLLLANVFGQDLADFVMSLSSGAGELTGLSSALPFISLIGLLVTLWAASNIFSYLHEALNTVWGVRPVAKGGIFMQVRRRLLAFLVIFIAGALLVLYLMANAAISLLVPIVNSLLPHLLENFPDFHILQLSQSLLLFLITTLLFATFYRILPDVAITWRDVFVGAAFTSLLFGIGVVILSVYFRYYTVSFAGAAGSLVVLLLWFYYSSQIFMFGAEFTYMYATRYGSKITPADYTEAVNWTLVTNKAKDEDGESEHIAELATGETAPVKTGPAANQAEAEDERSGEAMTT
jgi:membrane protein